MATYKPYSYKLREKNQYATKIYFEESIIMEHTGALEDAIRVVNALNGAYQLGYNAACLDLKSHINQIDQPKVT